MSSSPARILVIRYRYIGDTVLAVPALRNLRRAFPDAKIDVLVEPGTGDILGPCPYKDELLYWQPRRRHGATPRAGVQVGLLGPARWLRARRYDRVYILRRSFSSALLPFLAGIPRRVGFATQGRSFLLTHSTPYPDDKHEVECFLDVLRADNIPILDTHNEGWCDPAAEAKVLPVFAGRTRPQVMLCAKSAYAPKEWTPERFAMIAAWLVNERGCDLHICDAPGNRGYYEAIFAALPAPLAREWTDWSARLTLRESLAAICRMDLVIGIDTGLLHLAAGFHVPVVALFGPLDPVRWHPWDTPHTVLRPNPIVMPQPLLKLSVDEVKAAAAGYLPA